MEKRCWKEKKSPAEDLRCRPITDDPTSGTQNKYRRGAKQVSRGERKKRKNEKADFGGQVPAQIRQPLVWPQKLGGKELGR
jgi:hypothetical protein